MRFIKSLILPVFTIFLLIALITAGYFLFLIKPNPAPVSDSAAVNVTPEAMEVVVEVKVLAFGDLLLDRYIKKAIDKYGSDYPFKNIKSLLVGNDLTLANLEGAFTDFKPRPIDPNNISFTFDPQLLPAIKEAGFNIFSLANNHSQDFGRQGFSQSQAYLDANGIDYFGTFSNDGKISLVKNVKGLRFGFVGYNEFGNSAKGVIAEIKRIKPEVDCIIVFAHWGVEYKTNFSRDQEQIGRQFIDAGADIVLGSHPHVIQPIEIYKNRIIFYSLGNFVFDQIFSPDVTQGLGVGIIFAKNEIEFNLFPMQLKNFQANLANKESGGTILKDIAKRSIVSENVKNQIIAGKITISL
jgi:poly-gamma-glutamate synthesis protein (capsule biosynthesis protein)